MQRASEGRIGSLQPFYALSRDGLGFGHDAFGEANGQQQAYGLGQLGAGDPHHHPAGFFVPFWRD